MATTSVSASEKAAASSLRRGGSFLIEVSYPEEIFTSADLTDDQRLIGQTAEEFVAHEVLPHVHELEEHKDVYKRQGKAAIGNPHLLPGQQPMLAIGREYRSCSCVERIGTGLRLR